MPAARKQTFHLDGRRELVVRGSCVLVTDARLVIRLADFADTATILVDSQFGASARRIRQPPDGEDKLDEMIP